MKIKHGDIARKMAFVAVDVTDLITREAALTNAAVTYSLDGAEAVTMVDPIIAAAEADDMVGDFWLSINAGTTLPDGVDNAELILHISADEMAPVTLGIEIYRPTIDVGASRLSGGR